MSRILRQLGGDGGEREFVRFDDLFQAEDGVSVVVVSFLAILELARESLIEITQTAPLESIYVKLRLAEMPPLEPT
jgi:segregation and condensation protein A